ncbi:MAG: hypothetical protein ACLT8H_07735 [Streptococcus parasanguinis]
MVSIFVIRAQEILTISQGKTEENLTRKDEIGGDLYIGTAETRLELILWRMPVGSHS